MTLQPNKQLIPYLAKDLSPIDALVIPDSAKPAYGLELLERFIKNKRALALYMENCTRCGACINQCHSYLGTQDKNNIPVMRTDLVRRVYKKHLAAGPAFLRKLDGQSNLDNNTIDSWYKYFYQCNQCRRCAVFCPKGIDTAEVTIAMREVLAHLGMVPKFIMDVTRNLTRTGNNMGIPLAALEDSIDFLEDELKEETGKDIAIPLDMVGAEVLYNPSSADLFSNTDGLMGVAKMFYAAGVSWTLSSQIIETANFGLFFHEPTLIAHNKKLIRVGKQLKVKRIVAGECGHGWRTWRMFTKTINGPLPFPVVHVFEEALNYYRQKRIKFNKNKNIKTVTFHDPCNMSRATGIVEEPREILRECVSNFIEMAPRGYESYCCGGGSGLLMDEDYELRMKLGKAKADSVMKTGAEILCAPCAICKAQLPHVMKHYNIKIEVKGLTDLIGNALIL
ncbi:MAG: hypothetical protein APF76_14305 [Desulfitibacter sp. BRH_c19]|nr:MAG: hypothetical protein APF76_14305 [Desulfitibacter sp. BRH_c19]